MSRRASRTRSRLGVERLETRELPATLVSPTTVSYQDIDGDDVQVVFSKPILTTANVNSIFKFNAGTVDGNNTVGQQLRTVYLEDTPAAQGVSLTVTATKNAVNGGDDFAAVGQVRGASRDMRTVTIEGDLGGFQFGDSRLGTPGLAALHVQSIGKFGNATGAEFPIGVVAGNLGSLNVVEDISNVSISVSTSKIGKLSIGGSLVGGVDPLSGSIVARGIGSVAIGGSIVGGAVADTGFITVGDDKNLGVIGSMTIGGNLNRGPGGDKTGRVTSTGTIGSLTVNGSINGIVTAGRSLKKVMIGGHLNDGIIRSDGTVGTVSIAGNVNGGIVRSSGALTSVTVGGDVPWGTITSTGKAGSIAVTGDFGGSMTVGSSNSVKIGGDLKGGDGTNSGRLFSDGRIAKIEIVGNVLGGAATGSGGIDVARASIVSITGDVRGGDSPGGGSGYVQVDDVGTLTIGGNLIGGNSFLGATGYVHFVKASAITVNGDVKGGTGMTESGAIVGGPVGTLTVNGSVIGGDATGSDVLKNSGYIQAQRITRLVIGKWLIAGKDETTGTFIGNGAIFVTDNVGTATFGNLIGNATNPAIFAARGRANHTDAADVAIGKLTVEGIVDRAKILAGYSRQLDELIGANSDAQIGSVEVKGVWNASSLVAGVYAGDNGYFGDGDANEGKIRIIKDRANAFSRIGRVDLRGFTTGTADPTDFYGITAETVSAVYVGADGSKVALKSGRSNDNVFLGATDDFKVREV